MDKLDFSGTGTTLLIGPPMSNKKKILNHAIKSSVEMGEPVIYITTDFTADAIEKTFADDNIDDAKIYFIDCYTKISDQDVQDSDKIIYTSGPLALNEISVSISSIQAKINGRFLIIFNSLSTLIMYSKPDAIAHFVQVISAKTKRLGGSIVFVMDDGMHDTKVVYTIEHLMDNTINVMTKNKDVLYKDENSTEWTVFKDL